MILQVWSKCKNKRSLLSLLLLYIKIRKLWVDQYSKYLKFITLLFFFTLEGRRHDAGMLHDSGLLHNLEAYAYSATGLPMCLYGDPAYPLRVHLQGPFRNPHLTPLMEAYNSSMSSVRVSVEWLFGDIIKYFKFVDFKKNLKIGMRSIGKMYIVCALLQNALSCLYGNNTATIFWPWASHPARLFCTADVLKKRELYLLIKIYNLKQLWYAITWLPYEIWGATPPN